MRLSRTVRIPGLLALLAATLVYGGLRLSARPAHNPTLIGYQPDTNIFLPTGQTLSPAGHNLSFDGRPVDMALRPDGKLLAVMLADQVKLFDTAKGQFLPDALKGNHSYGGLAWSKDGSTLYATGKVSKSGGDEDAGAGAVFVTHWDGADQPTAQAPITFKLNSRIKPNLRATDALPAGLALAPDGKTLYVTLFNNGTLAAVDLGSYDPATGAAKCVETPVGSSPERVVVSPSGEKVYVANRGGRKPEAGDTMDFEDPVVVDPETYKASTGTISVVVTAQLVTDAEHAATQSIPVGLQPADLALSSDGKRLYVANANSETVSVVDTETSSVVETIPTSPAPGRLAAGSPNGLAIARDGATLYVTLGGDNAVEVMRLDNPAGGKAPRTEIAGLIPTAWFPLGVTLSQDGATLYVANVKGVGSLGPTVKRPQSTGMGVPQEGPGGTVGGGNVVGHSVYAVMGSLGVIPTPDVAALAKITQVVTHNNHFDRMQAALTQRPDPYWSRFKHVILVIKENRTYDQVFGDMKLPSGHLGGDPNLVMFGEQVTPNQHALAREYGLFDNLYCTGSISADGHHWLNEAFADDYDERAMNRYPRSYPCCGTDPLAYAGNKFIWQAAMDAGVTFRNYGEFAPLPSIKRHSSKSYDSHYDVTADSNEDVAHADRILADLSGSGPESGLAQLTTIWFPNDHTSGTRPGAYTPESDVADNDLAVGKLVDAVSHSKKYWHDEPTAIFVVEDDAQGGLDHVDGHRTVALVISPYNKRHQIFSANFNQLHMLRTIELMLGMKPLNQFDAATPPMREVFQERAGYQPYAQHKNEIALNLRNPPLKKLTGAARHWAAVSASLDFSAPDRADPELLTAVLWHHAHDGR
jgi:YVTN family beta-propeller protein